MDHGTPKLLAKEYQMVRTRTNVGIATAALLAASTTRRPSSSTSA